MAESLEAMKEYFSACSQNELVAWGVVTLGFLAFIAGVILLFL